VHSLLHLNERVPVTFVGAPKAPKAFGKGILKNRTYYLSFFPIFERNNVKLLNCSLWGFYCWV
jgi:hypothetical protein